jgi:hypothetical protein
MALLRAPDQLMNTLHGFAILIPSRKIELDNRRRIRACTDLDSHGVPGEGPAKRQGFLLMLGGSAQFGNAREFFVQGPGYDWPW